MGSGAVPWQVQPAVDVSLRAMARKETLLEACAGVHPSALLQRVLPLLAPSASFAVWCPFLQPLADAMQEMQARHALVKSAEQWGRSFVNARMTQTCCNEPFQWVSSCVQLLELRREVGTTRGKAIRLCCCRGSARLCGRTSVAASCVPELARRPLMPWPGGLQTKRQVVVLALQESCYPSP